MITYEYEKDVYDINRLVDEIRNSSITIALDHVSAFGNQLSKKWLQAIGNGSG